MRTKQKFKLLTLRRLFLVVSVLILFSILLPSDAASAKSEPLPYDPNSLSNNPRITSLDPDHGPGEGGNTVKIKGFGFKEVEEVYFGNISITASPSKDTEIEVTAPPAEITCSLDKADVSVKTKTSTSNKITYTYIIPSPTVYKIVPKEGPTEGGTEVTITGDNFPHFPYGDVYFGSIKVSQGDYKFVSKTTLVVMSPPGQSVGDIPVWIQNNNGGKSEINSDCYFTYDEAFLDKRVKN